MDGIPDRPAHLRGQTATALAGPAILFAAAFFPVSRYVSTMAMGALDFFKHEHDFIVFFLSLLSLPLYHIL
jgi:hypothetical protein